MTKTSPEISFYFINDWFSWPSLWPSGLISSGWRTDYKDLTYHPNVTYFLKVNNYYSFFCSLIIKRIFWYFTIGRITVSRTSDTRTPLTPRLQTWKEWSDREGEGLTWDWPEQRNFLAWMLVMVPFSCSSSTAALKILLISSETFLQALSFFVLAALLNSIWCGRRIEREDSSNKGHRKLLYGIFIRVFATQREVAWFGSCFEKLGGLTEFWWFFSIWALGLR